MTDRSGERLYSAAEAAEEVGISRVAIWYAIDDGRLPATRVGRNWVIRERDLMKFKQRRDRRKEG